MTGHIPESFIEELLSRVDIVEIINSHLPMPLRRQGANFTANCPFHSERTPSFTVSQTKQFYHCFGCGAHGTAIGFLMEYEGIHFVEACESLASRVGLKMPEEIENQTSVRHKELYGLLESANKFFQEQLRKPSQNPSQNSSNNLSLKPDNRAINYLKSRGLTGRTAKTFGIGYAPPEWDGLIKAFSKNNSQKLLKDLLAAGLVVHKEDENSKTQIQTQDQSNNQHSDNPSNHNHKNNQQGHYYDRFRDRIMFPIRDRRGRVLGFGGRILDKGTPKYLNSPETAVFSKGREVYGLYEAKTKNRHLDSLIIVEGYIDVVCLAQFGIENVVATLGTAVTEKHLELLFKQVPELYFCFDGDTAGRTAAKRAFQISLPHMKEGRRVKFVFLPNSEDPDSYVRRHGKKAFLELLDHAHALSDYLFEVAGESLDLNHIEGRAELVTKAKVLIAKLPEGVLKQMMFERLTEISGIQNQGGSQGRQGQSGWQGQPGQQGQQRQQGLNSGKYGGNTKNINNKWNQNGKNQHSWAQGGGNQKGRNQSSWNQNSQSGQNGWTQSGNRFDFKHTGSNSASNFISNVNSYSALPPIPAFRALAMLLENRNLLSLISDTREFSESAFSAVSVLQRSDSHNSDFHKSAFEWDEGEGTSLFCAIIGILQKDMTISVQAILEKLPENYRQIFRSVIESNDLKSIARFIPENGMEAEFLGAIARLKERAGEQALEFLLEKAKTHTLTPEDKLELRYLIDQKDKDRVD